MFCAMCSKSKQHPGDSEIWTKTGCTSNREDVIRNHERTSFHQIAVNEERDSLISKTTGGEFRREDVVKKVGESSFYSILIDETTDISLLQLVIVYVKFMVEEESQIKFLAMEDESSLPTSNHCVDDKLALAVRHSNTKIKTTKTARWLSQNKACETLRQILQSVVMSLVREANKRYDSLALGQAKNVQPGQFITVLYSKMSSKKEPGGDWGWIITLACFIEHILYIGSINTMGIYHVYIMNEFNEDITAVTVIGALYISVSVSGAFLRETTGSGDIPYFIGCAILCVSAVILIPFSNVKQTFKEQEIIIFDETDFELEKIKLTDDCNNEYKINESTCICKKGNN
ncbi:unnamed protein product [Mytilus coruscus]|uniref:DUF4371 domain-containing protein n=1 Tax=Mytilus coruscus TaxID=42192 RepID=A0A6J8ACI8_MYTCO|nr:unnamed protein product [Mytilus coruscus]